MNKLWRVAGCFLVLALACNTVDPLTEPAAVALWEEPEYGDIPWWNQGVFYEIYVRSFRDSDGDRFGDFQGLIEKLDYLNDGDPNTSDDLGISAIWLMPIQENLSTNLHGYHTEDYYSVEADYGTKEDLRELIDEAHKRGIKVIIDLVINPRE
jgi:alpha-amylase